MATRFSYPHVNLGYGTVAEIAIKRTHGSVKRTLRLRFYINGEIKHIVIETL